MARKGWASHRLSETLAHLSEGLSGSELTSLLLEVMRRRVKRRSAHEVLEQYLRDPFCAPAPVDVSACLSLDQVLFSAASSFQAVELSPLAPIGSCAVVAPTDQYRVVSALRSSEVVADSTNVLALECAKRLRAPSVEAVHLAASHRVLRAQPVPKLPGYEQHFRLFALASGGRETAEHGFTVAALSRHISAFLAALRRLPALGYQFRLRRVVILTTAMREALGRRVGAQIRAAPVEYAPLDHSYYSGGLRYQIWLEPAEGDEAQAKPVVDGGVFDWLAQLLSNRRAVFVASGLGTQVLLRFARR